MNPGPITCPQCGHTFELSDALILITDWWNAQVFADEYSSELMAYRVEAATTNTAEIAIHKRCARRDKIPISMVLFLEKESRTTTTI